MTRLGQMIFDDGVKKGMEKGMEKGRESGWSWPNRFSVWQEKTFLCRKLPDAVCYRRRGQQILN